MSALIRKQKAAGDVDSWLPGYQTELSEVKKRRLQELTAKEVKQHGVERRAVGLRMILEQKKDGRRKGRLIAQGFKEPLYLDGGPVDAPVAALATIRTLLFMAGLSTDVVSSIDVSTAFLQADEYGDDAPVRYVYYQPHRHAPKQYYRLKGALYGQRSASLEWHKTLSKWLVDSQGFEQGLNDACVYVHPKTGLKLAIVVDDVLCRGSSKATASFYEAMAKRFEVKSPTYLTAEKPITYVGLGVSIEEYAGKRYITVDQGQDLRRYLDALDLPHTGMVSNPMSNKWVPDMQSPPLSVERAQWYRAVIGSLNFYACATRYDISFAVSRLAQFSAKPTEDAEKAVLRVLAYLKSHVDFCLSGSYATDVDTVEVYSDSDHAGSREVNCRSQSGSMVILNKVPVYWRSKKQPSTSISSACAEIYALSETVKEARLFQWRGEELGMKPLSPLSVQVDNAQAISFSKGTCVNSRLRGTFDIRADWVRELRNRFQLAVVPVSSSNNCADLCTKAHPTQRFQQLLKLISGTTTSKMIQERAMLAMLV